MPIAWDADPPGSQRQIETNVLSVLRDIQAGAAPRAAPTVAVAQAWHRRIYAGVTLPVSYYAGEFRDDDPRHPELRGYEVAVGPARGVPSLQVHSALAAFQAAFQHALQRVDAAVAAGAPPADATQLAGVIQLAAAVHGAWIRIHPFANGNGRTARLWVAWVAARYSLPLFLRVRPRPDAFEYALAARYSMLGDHSVMELFLERELRRVLGGQ